MPKVLHPVAGQPMIKHILAACTSLKPAKLVVVTGPKMKAVQEIVAPHKCVIQPKPLGTGDAVKAARRELKTFKGEIIVLFGDTPLVTAEALQGLRKKRAETNAAIVVAGFTAEDPASYGRLIMDKRGHLTAIVETKDANPSQRKVRLCNGGIMLFAADKLWPLLSKLRNDNSQSEFYLTDCVKLARKESWTCAVADMPAEDVRGINSRVELAEVEQLMQQRLRKQAMLNGATLLDPATTYLSADTAIGRDVTIGPNVFIGPGVEIADNVEIRAFCHLEQAKIKTGAIIGPFARLRPGSVIGENAHIGNFVEIKKAEVGAGAKINHLSYIGDATVGSKANIGAGTITCNYDGFHKAQTKIGAGAFIGSNTALVAPVTVGDGAFVGAGSVISMNVPADALAVARARQMDIKNWARRYRKGKAKEKQ
jgi:bifunctional UDP-N-acetylglucosamine pyrophosphorylase/glucosamine-1-phosphate N-acetyltransferase